MSRYRRELGVGVATALLLVVLGIFAPGFFSARHLVDIAVTKSYLLVCAVGMTVVILARQIDISIGSQFAVCGVLAATLASLGLPLPCVIAGTIAAGALLGAINGAFVAGLGLPSIVATLATMVTWQQGIRWITEGQPVTHADGFQWLGLDQRLGQATILGTALEIYALFSWGLRRLSVGRAVYAVGSDREAAFLAGIRPRLVTFGVFVTMGALAGTAALLNGMQLPQGDPTSGQGLELQVIAAVVVGGTVISGGRGTALGTLIGVVLLAVVGPALVFLNVEAAWEKAIQGLIILVAVASDAFNLRRRRDAGAGLAAH